MRIVRVFPRQTSYTPNDPLAFVGDPPLPQFQPQADEVHVSVTFTWDMDEGRRLAQAWEQYYPVVRLGGPAMGSQPGKFTPGLYITKGVTFTTRGCNNRCPWCEVPKREGNLIETADFAPGHIIQDNNLLQASQTHQEAVFQMLRSQRRGVIFSGGLQADLVTDWFVKQLQATRVHSLFLAADTDGALKPLERAVKKLSFLPRRRLRVYVMIGRDETFDQAEDRLEAVWSLGAMPFAQLYQPADGWIEYPSEWKQLVRTWSRPAAMVTKHKQTFELRSEFSSCQLAACFR